MMKCEPITQALINLAKGLYICQCGVSGKIRHTLCDDDGKPVSVVIELDNGDWKHELLSDFDMASAH